MDNNPSASQANVDAAKKAIDDAMNAIKNKANQTSAQPTDVQSVKDAQGTAVTGKATPGSTVEVKDQDGNVLGTAEADKDGNFTVPVSGDVSGDLHVTAQEPGRKASEAVKAVDKTGLEDSITAGDKLSEDGNVTTDDGTKVPVDPADKEALDKALEAGKAVDNDPSASQANVDAAKKKIDDAMKNIKDKANQTSAQPTNVQAVKDANGTNVTGKATPGSTVEVKDQNGNVVGTAKADENGNFTVPVSGDVSGDLAVTAKEPGKQVSAATPVETPKVDKSALETSIEKGDAVQDATQAEKDALDKALQKGKDVRDNPASTQADVDKAQQDIEDALNRINGKSVAPSDVKVSDNGTTVTGKAAPGAEVVVADKDGNVLGKATADKDGNFEVKLSTPQTNGEKLAVSAKEEGKDPAATTAVAPKVDKSGLQSAIKDGNEVANTSKDDIANLEEALDNGNDVNEKASATQKEVDDAKKAIEDALNRINGKSVAPSGVEVADNGTTVTGKAAPGAEVVVADKDGNVLGKATADKDGNFAVELSTPQTNGEKLAVSAKEADKQPATTTAVAPKVDKSGLNQAIADGKEATQGDNYAQANQADKDALDKALEAGKQVTANPAATQVEVNNAKKAIEDALNRINGKSVAPSGVEVADNGTTVTGKAAPGAEVVVADKDGNVLGKATADKDGNFEVKLSTPQTNGEKLAVSAKEADKQPATTTAVAPKVDKSGLQSAIKNGTEHANKVQDDISALEKALDNGKKVDADASASQAEVDQAQKAIEEAIANTTGKSEAPSGVKVSANGTSLTGKAKPGATVTVTDKAGNKLGTAIVDEDGNFTVTFAEKPQTNGEELVVTAQETGKDAASAAAVAPNVDKANLQAAIDEAKQFQTTDVYANAAQADKDTLAKVLMNGQAVMVDAAASQAEVDAAEQAIRSAMKAIQDKANQSSAAPANVKVSENGSQVTGEATPGATVTVADKNGNVLGTAVADANGNFVVVLTTPQTAGQELAVTAQEAGKKANSTSVVAPKIDKSGLQTAVDAGRDFQATAAYANASQAAKDDLNKALTNGQAVLADTTVSQAEVDAAQQAILEAMKALAGAKDVTDTTTNVQANDNKKATSAENGQKQLPQTGEEKAATGMVGLAAILGAFGLLGATKKRKED
ncbi:hypothetical protein FC36_GL000846 [Ligilactobacillus equi DSM 15833 = JCM 10991]|uniref:Gram-positive cocci surface proteins LPxTG domain-containing protein n=1 Tax=Ligilactobacillus equi DSM 15833 = JCM 10991 TaxID=1423740 RepID=A0A0R1TDK7_9LACO|nr:hypothetical protein FC36_GL000846 [Ligilactobacillus equi DSM 15833 = JCM 10991]